MRCASLAAVAYKCTRPRVATCETHSKYTMCSGSDVDFGEIMEWNEKKNYCLNEFRLGSVRCWTELAFRLCIFTPLFFRFRFARKSYCLHAARERAHVCLESLGIAFGAFIFFLHLSLSLVWFFFYFSLLAISWWLVSRLQDGRIRFIWERSYV